MSVPARTAGLMFLSFAFACFRSALLRGGWSRRRWSTVSAVRGAFALLGVCCPLLHVWFLWRDESPPTRTATIQPR
jgi:hypothetical protein